MTNIEKAKSYGRNWARSMFFDFLDHTEDIGSKFTWEKFPELACKFAKHNLFLSIPAKTNRKKMEAACISECEKCAKELIKDHLHLSV